MCTTSSELGNVIRQREVGLRSGEVVNFRDFVVDFSTPMGATGEKRGTCPTSGVDFSEMRNENRNPRKTSRGIRLKSMYTDF